MLVEVCLDSLYFVNKIVVSNMDVDNFILRVSRVKIIESSTEFLEYDTGSIVKVHVDS